MQLYIYDDRAYVLRPYLQISFQGAVLNEEQIMFNIEMISFKKSV